MGGDHEFDRVARHADLRQRLEQARHRVLSAGVDESGPAGFDDEIAGVVPGPLKPGVYDVHAVRERLDERWRFGHAQSIEPPNRAADSRQRHPLRTERMG